MYKSLLFCLLCLLMFGSCQKDDSSGSNSDLALQLEQVLEEAHENGKSHFQLPSGTSFNLIPQDPNNPITAEKVELGRMLYHDPSFGVNPENNIGEGTYSCATCHFAEGGFAARKAQGIGEGGLGTSGIGLERTKSNFYAVNEIDVQPIKSPSTLNVAYQELMLWNGQFGGTGMNLGTEAQWTPGTPKEKNELGFQGVETQAIAGIEVHRLMYNDTLIQQHGYKPYFDAAFEDITDLSVRYSNLTAALSIAAYERTLLPNQAPFQKWLRGFGSAMTEAQFRGAVLFFGNAECVSCHSGPALNSMSFSAIGMDDLNDSNETVFNVSNSDDANLGRGGFTQRPEDMYKFKVPQLYNLADSPFYGHGASFTSIFDIIKYKSIGIPQNREIPQTNLDARFQPLGLSDAEIDDLTAFLEYGLRDPALDRYLPEVVPSGSCFPNNDELSQYESGCN